MKRILTIVCLLFSVGAMAQVYVPSAHTVSNKSYGLAQPLPIDARSWYRDNTTFTMRPFNSTGEVLSYLPANRRSGNFPIFVSVGGETKMYMFKNCTADTCLKEIVMVSAEDKVRWDNSVPLGFQSVLDVSSSLSRADTIFMNGYPFFFSGGAMDFSLTNNLVVPKRSEDPLAGTVPDGSIWFNTTAGRFKGHENGQIIDWGSGGTGGVFTLNGTRDASSVTLSPSNGTGYTIQGVTPVLAGVATAADKRRIDSSVSSIKVIGDTLLQYFKDGVLSGQFTLKTTPDGNNYVDLVSFNAGNGVLTLNRLGLSALSTNIDGRYPLNQTFLDSCVSLRNAIGSGTGGADGNNFTTGASFNQSTGVVSVTRNGLSTITYSIDGRYPLNQTFLDSVAAVRSFAGTRPDANNFTTAVTFNSSTEALTTSRNGLSDIVTSLGGAWPRIQRFNDSLAAVRSTFSLYAPSSHTHSIAQVTGLQAALDGKEGVLPTGTTNQYIRGDKTLGTFQNGSGISWDGTKFNLGGLLAATVIIGENNGSGKSWVVLNPNNTFQANAKSNDGRFQSLLESYVGGLDYRLYDNVSGLDWGMQVVPGLSTIHGRITVDTLSGSGTRMVVADPAGQLSTQAIPSGGTGSTVTGLTYNRTNRTITLNQTSGGSQTVALNDTAYTIENAPFVSGSNNLLVGVNDSTSRVRRIRFNGADTTGSTADLLNVTFSGGGSVADVTHTHTSGVSFIVNTTTNVAIIDPASTISNLTITLPATAHSSGEITLYFGGSLTSGVVVNNVIIAPNSGQTILQASVPTEIVAGESITYKRIGNTWRRKY